MNIYFYLKWKWFSILHTSENKTNAVRYSVRWLFWISLSKTAFSWWIIFCRTPNISQYFIFFPPKYVSSIIKLFAYQPFVRTVNRDRPFYYIHIIHNYIIINTICRTASVSSHAVRFTLFFSHRRPYTVIIIL